MATTVERPTDDGSCTHGSEGCPGPVTSGDELPCFHCWIETRCPRNRPHCDGPHTRDDHTGSYCRLCAIRAGKL